MITKTIAAFSVWALSLAGSAQSQAAVVELGSTTMIFNASGEPNGIAGSWNAAPLSLISGGTIDYYKIQLTRLTFSSTNNAGRPVGITFYSSPESNGGIRELSLCGSMVSCVSDTVVGDVGIVDTGNAASIFLSQLAYGHVSKPYQFTDLYVSFANGGGTATASGQVLVQAFGTAPVPEPETYAMFLAGLGLVGFVASRRRAT